MINSFMHRSKKSKPRRLKIGPMLTGIPPEPRHFEPQPQARIRTLHDPDFELSPRVFSDPEILSSPIFEQLNKWKWK